MFPEDRVLVGVINRKRDLEILQTEGWYRIPQAKMPDGVSSEYVGFFLSRVFQERNGGIHYFAEQRGVELLYRKDLLPKEKKHPRAKEKYYKVQIGELMEKTPPILNPTRRSISFIYTTWDRFVHGRQISDLYAEGGYYVDRVYYAVQNKDGSRPTWSAQYRKILKDLGMRDPGDPRATRDDPVYRRILADPPQDPILAKIIAEIEKQPGPVYANIPFD